MRTAIKEHYLRAFIFIEDSWDLGSLCGIEVRSNDFPLPVHCSATQEFCSWTRRLSKLHWTLKSLKISSILFEGFQPFLFSGFSFHWFVKCNFEGDLSTGHCLWEEGSSALFFWKSLHFMRRLRLCFSIGWGSSLFLVLLLKKEYS